MGELSSAWLYAIVVCALVSIVLCLATIYRCGGSSKATSTSILPLSIDTSSLGINSNNIEEIGDPLDTAIGSTRSSGSSTRYCFGPNSISSVNSSSNRILQWSPEMLKVRNSGTPIGLNKVIWSQPWAPPHHGASLDSHEEEAVDYAFIEQFEDSIVDSYEHVTGFCFDYILDTISLNGLCQWVRHLQLQNSALRLQRSQPRALVPPHVQMVLGHNSMTRITVATTKEAILYAAQLFKANGALRESQAIAFSDEDDPQQIKNRPLLNSTSHHAASTANQGGGIGAHRRRRQDDDRDEEIIRQTYDMIAQNSNAHASLCKDIELGYTVKRYYGEQNNFDSNGFILPNGKSGFQPHPSELAQLKKNLFAD